MSFAEPTIRSLSIAVTPCFQGDVTDEDGSGSRD
jgi:hypothetical protein